MLTIVLAGHELDPSWIRAGHYVDMLVAVLARDLSYGAGWTLVELGSIMLRVWSGAGVVFGHVFARLVNIRR